MKFYFTIIFICFSTYLYTQSIRDNQFWYYTGISGKVNDNLKLLLDEEVHLVKNATFENFHHIRLGINYKINSFLFAGADNRIVYAYDTTWYKEIRPQFHTTILYKIKGIEISNKARMDYRTFDNQPSYWRYVNYFSIVYLFKLKQQLLRPYIADMLFMKKMGSNDVLMNRIYIGVGTILFHHVDVDLHYIFIKYYTGTNQLADVSGVKLMYQF